MIEIYFYSNLLQELNIEVLDFIDKFNLVLVYEEGNRSFYIVKNLLYVIYKNNTDYTVKVWELTDKVVFGDTEKHIVDDEVIDIYNKERFLGWLLIRRYY